MRLRALISKSLVWVKIWWSKVRQLIQNPDKEKKLSKEDIQRIYSDENIKFMEEHKWGKG